MIGNRPSSLPVARYCGLAPRLGAEHGAGTSARLSKAFHAKMAGQLEPHQWEALTDKEQDEVNSWHAPTDVRPEKGPLLRYADAHKELPVGFTEDYEPCLPDDPRCLTGGTLDFCWVVDARDGTRVVFVADIKRTRYAAIDGPTSLQLLAYCWAACAKFNADAYCPGLWIAEEGRWDWAPHIWRVDSPEAVRHLEQVEAAARNRGEPVTGSHCRDCYQRLHCPEWTSAPVWEDALAQADVSPAMVQQLTDDNALSALLEAQRLKDIAERALENIKAAVAHGKVTMHDPATNKQFRALTKRGRKSFNQKLAREHLGDDTIDRFVTQGPEIVEFRWLKM